MSLATFGDRRRLRLEFGLVSAQGRRSSNQDFVAFCPGPKDGSRGSVAVVADGLGGHKGGREAAETTVRAFIDGYFGAAESLSPEQAAFRALEAINGWVAAQARCDQKLQGMATTFTALLFIGGAAHVVHVGDSRAYRYAASRLEQLTIDHLADTGAMALALQRAIGIEPQVRIDHSALDLAPHDRFLLCSDGLHGVLSPARVADILRRAGTPQEASRQLKNAALEAGGKDNVSVLVVDILDTPPASRERLLDRLADAPFATPPEPGETIDGYRLEALVAETQRHRIFRATDQGSERAVALKFPRTGADEPERKAAFVQAAWVAFRVAHPVIAEAIAPRAGRQSRLYAVAPFYDGETLEARIRRRPLPSLGEGLSIAGPLARALGHLHRRGIVHRALGADHVILLHGGGVRLIGLGHAQGGEGRECEATGEFSSRPEAAPELAAGGRPNEKTDIYALGATCFRLFTGVDPNGDSRLLSRLRPDLPSWLGAVLANAMAEAPDQRPEDAFEFAYEIERPAPLFEPPRKRPFYERNPRLFWQAMSLALLIALIVSLAWR